VGRPATSNMVADYVLSTFKPNEKELMDEKFDEISDFIKEFLGA
jgi:peptidyl-tRNA hydrolase